MLIVNCELTTFNTESSRGMLIYSSCYDYLDDFLGEIMLSQDEPPPRWRVDSSAYRQ